MNTKTLLAILAILLVPAAGAATPEPAQAVPAQAVLLRAKFASLAEPLRNNPYRRPLHIESTETDTMLKGEVYGVVPYPYAALSAALTEAAPWCDILILPVTTKGCRVGRGADGAYALSLRVGLKYELPLMDAYPVEFTMRVTANSPQYFAVSLGADSGPLNTRDYRVTVEATPLDAGKSFLHLRYSYGFGTPGRLAMRAYLATLGANKVGFTSTGGTLTGGTRGVIERNTMRFFLAIDSHLAAASLPATERLERRLNAWFDSNEQYARQLHEMDRADYLAMKRREIQRQMSPQEFATPQRSSAGF